MASWSVGPYEITPRQNLRVGTAEREHAAAALSRHFSAGRLEMDEFDVRVKAAYAARTQKDLSVLLADLPGPESARRRPRVRFLPALIVLAALGIVLIFTAFPPLLLLPALFVVLRLRRYRRYQPGPATGWRAARRASAQCSSSGW